MEEIEKFDLSKALPAIPRPYEVSGEERIKKLEGYLKDERIKSQRSNIQFVINMYKTGKLKSLLGPPNGRSIYVCDGQVYHSLPDLEEIMDRPVWFEKERQQMKLWSSYVQIEPGAMHKFYARLRLSPSIADRDSKNLPYIIVQLSNDTGSNIQTIFTSDLAQLNYNAGTYHATQGYDDIMTAAGVVVRPSILIQLMILDSDGYKMTDWFAERATVVDDSTGPFGLERLSGTEIRKQLYMFG
ncbi:uncharacterized protein N7518_009968 [Penicillium psychrosexuale]|uniref:uncharacterized protein n=1 Tax=Penicillium psychrosexuale TaxID=1002107 RepID=UPI0025451AC7|nr:uncharacterized protein N7518_009968 [Penicillium psychrosexuale]KAJ5781485.1 hypothetical protein N7518_009968 [Penicillium psychrosexuale]